MEVGAYFDVYLKEMEIMSVQFVDPSRCFLSLYLKFEMGANWTDDR